MTDPTDDQLIAEQNPNPVVLISPAMAIGSGYYRLLVAAFAERGWHAVALGRRGFEAGGPRASRRNDWGYADEIADIADAVASARQERPDRPVLLLGHSLGGQLAAGHQLTREPADGVITIGAAIPRFQRFPYGGLPLALMASVIVPVTTGLWGYLPKPAFGAPGARTMMREWARMVLTGRPPFAKEEPISSPALVISLDGDELSPLAAVEDFSRQLFNPKTVTRWHYHDDEVPTGASNDHITWARTPDFIVEMVISWWATSPKPVPATRPGR